MPVSRSMQIDSRKAQLMREIYEDYMRTGGIFLVQPEHILSFEMMVAEYIMFGDKDYRDFQMGANQFSRHP